MWQTGANRTKSAISTVHLHELSMCLNIQLSSVLKVYTWHVCLMFIPEQWQKNIWKQLPWALSAAKDKDCALVAAARRRRGGGGGGEGGETSAPSISWAVCSASAVSSWVLLRCRPRSQLDTDINGGSFLTSCSETWRQTAALIQLFSADVSRLFIYRDLFMSPYSWVVNGELLTCSWW